MRFLKSSLYTHNGLECCNEERPESNDPAKLRIIASAPDSHLQTFVNQIIETANSWIQTQRNQLRTLEAEDS